MKRLAALSVLILLLATPLCAKDKYHITLTIKNGKDTLMIMGRYFAHTNEVIDSARIDRKGRFVFSGDDELEPGMYFFANPQGTYVEFFIYHEKPFFDFTTTEGNWAGKMKVKGSKENDFFFTDYGRITERINQKMDIQHKVLDSAAFREYAKTCHEEMDRALDSLKNAQPERALSKLMRCTDPILPPTSDEEGFELTEKQRYDYFMEHYFDHMPLDDEFLIHTPKRVFYEPVMRYFDKYLKGAPPEEICKYADSLIERSRPAKRTFQWLVHTLTNKYLKRPVMVYDSVYVHLSKKYYVSGEAWWAEPSTIDEEAVRVSKWEKLLVGKVAPELILFDTMHNAHSLHYLPSKYKLLIFWSPTCGHCKTVIPAIYKLFEKYAQQVSLSAFAILSEPDDNTRALWKKFMVEKGINHSRWINLDGGEANVDWHEVYDVTTTPQIYLLDEENKIVAKKLNAETFEMVMEVLVKENKN